MPENSQFLIHEDEGSIHLKLVGEFDANSAIDVLNLVNKRSPMISRVFIHTNSLKEVYPFACCVFHNHLNTIRGQFESLIFTGAHADTIAI